MLNNKQIINFITTLIPWIVSGVFSSLYFGYLHYINFPKNWLYIPLIGIMTGATAVSSVVGIITYLNNRKETCNR